MIERHEKQPQPEISQKGNIIFEITKLVDVSEGIVESVKTGTSMVWERHVDEPTTMTITFGSRIINKESIDTGRLAQYSPENDQFSFAMDTIKEKAKSESSQQPLTLLFSSHEATHKVQIYRGDQLPAIKDQTQEEYFTSPYEKEAWDEALHVVKKVYPQLRVSFKTGPLRYTSPRESKY